MVRLVDWRSQPNLRVTGIPEDVPQSPQQSRFQSRELGRSGHPMTPIAAPSSLVLFEDASDFGGEDQGRCHP
ncbi:hypothetical protein CDL15_Pgr026052 [Punica granatum]|uniref:Uncharacterized protein n=1 Tax=Punica granatum TaxID=22663 RepID=A0A218WDP4_PUNGR|nr:hypothetical protein CDL15_Pgr026052 [Punica granatum]